MDPFGTDAALHQPAPPDHMLAHTEQGKMGPGLG